MKITKAELLRILQEEVELSRRDQKKLDKYKEWESENQDELRIRDDVAFVMQLLSDSFENSSFSPAVKRKAKLRNVDFEAFKKEIRDLIYRDWKEGIRNAWTKSIK